MGTEDNDLNATIDKFDPTDPEQLSALEKTLLGGVGIVPPDTDAPVEGEASAKSDDQPTGVDPSNKDEKPAEAAPAGAEPAEGVASDTEPQKVVLARDGKHVIPYHVLERERDRALRAEQTAQALADEIKRLQDGHSEVAAQPDAVLSAEELADLEIDQPAVAKAIRGQMAMIEELKGRLTALARERDVDVARQQAATQDDVSAAIAGNAQLSAWQQAAGRDENPDPRLWNRAADVDAQLRADPEWAERSLEDRFAKVVEIVRVMSGMPPTEAQVSTQTAQPDLKQVADAKLKAATSAQVPMSLSDIPGGVPPAQSDMELLENASPVALGQKFMAMTPDQIESYLARLAA